MKTAHEPTYSFVILTLVLIVVNTLIAWLCRIALPADVGGVSRLYVAVAFMILFTLWFGAYGAIAAYLGTKMSARMVGWAMNGAHLMKGIPAHRVVNRNGMLSGKMHFSTPTQMEELLKKEKVKVINDMIVDFEKKFWDPAVELSLL